MSNDDIAATIEHLAARVRELEDERAILQVITSYSFAVDSDSPELTASMYAPDAVIEIADIMRMDGREEIEAMVRSDGHQALLPDCCHMMGPFVVKVDGDAATATGYATVFHVIDGRRHVWRQAVNRWTLARAEVGWQVTHRISHPLGAPEAHETLRAGAITR